PDEVRRRPEQHLALGERLGHQAEFILFQVTQPAVDQLAARGAGVRAEVVLLDEQDAQPPPGRVARDAGAVDAAADDEKIDAPGYRGIHQKEKAACAALCPVCRALTGAAAPVRIRATSSAAACGSPRVARPATRARPRRSRFPACPWRCGALPRRAST